MRALYVVFIGAALLASAGCSTTGGTLGGLLPAPKFLKGSINNDIYTSKDKSFSIAVPHKTDSYEYKYMHIKEQYAEQGAYVSFGPAAFDKGIYRLEITKRVPEIQHMTFDELAPKAVESYGIQLQQGFGTIPDTVEAEWDSINGRRAYRYKSRQHVPAGKYLTDREATLSHEAYIIDFEKVIAIVWTQIPDITPKPAMNARAFAESATIHSEE